VPSFLNVPCICASTALPSPSSAQPSAFFSFCTQRQLFKTCIKCKYHARMIMGAIESSKMTIFELAVLRLGKISKKLEVCCAQPSANANEAEDDDDSLQIKFKTLRPLKCTFKRLF